MLTKYTVIGLVPGSNYQFQVYVTSVCGKSSAIQLKVDTKIAGKYEIETNILVAYFLCHKVQLKLTTFSFL